MIDNRSDTPVRALTLELTKGCNLRCGYCYYAEREDAYQPATRMSAEVAAQSVDLLFAHNEGWDKPQDFVLGAVD